MSTWKETLSNQIPEALGREIDIYETQMELRRQGKLEEKIFGEMRLRRGVYGQRYDNGQRNDGTGTKEIAFPRSDLMKGPETRWDAPGMVRIKIPYGALGAAQMDLLADLAEEYSDGICHVTTRQDIQLHYVHIEDTPDLMRRLAAVGITTREACGNSVRNVTACPIAGVCREETFDVTPYSKALAGFLLGHPDCQDFGRKFKIAFSGCAHNGCGLVTMHDLGLVARRQKNNGADTRGFEVHVGGGLGAVPYMAKVLYEFVPAGEIFPLALAIARVFARLGEKRNRARARIKFLVKKLGIEEFRRLVEEERKDLVDDDSWTAWLPEAERWTEQAARPAAASDGVTLPEGYDDWARTNVYRQRQEGYATVTVTLALGDVTSTQMRQLADIARKYVGDHVRLTVDQNLLFRWIPERDLSDLYGDLRRIGLGEPGAGSVVDVTACPGTDTCKLGIASSRGLARELRGRLAAQSHELDESVRGLHIKVSGCFNSCGQHHVADLGFYGVSRKISRTTVPHFQVVLGGKWNDNAGAYGLAVGAVPSKRIPDVVSRVTEKYLAEREKNERFQDYVRRIGKVALRDLFEDLMKVPAYDEDRTFYSDWGDPREFTIGDMGKGECAGEVVSMIEFDLAAAEREVFEAQVLYDEGQFEKADRLAYRAMLTAARGLVKTRLQDVSDAPDVIVTEFRTRLFDTQLYWDRFAGGKFANYLFQRHEEGTSHEYSAEGARHLIEEAQLFIEGAHACNARLDEQPAVLAAGEASPA